MLVCLGDRSAQTVVRAAALRQKLQTTCYSVSRGQICSDGCTCCGAETEAADNMLVCLGDRSAQTVVRAAALRQKLQTTCYSVSRGQICSDGCTCCGAETEAADQCLLVACLLNVPATCWLLDVPTCQCISGTDLHRQFYELPH